MKSRKLLIVPAAIAAIAGFLVAGNSFADGGRWTERMAAAQRGLTTACARSASQMHKSCSFEVREEYYATLAKCANVVDFDERADCADEAKEVRREDSAGCRDQEEARFDVCDLLSEDFHTDPLLDPSIGFVDPDAIGDTELPNPYFSLVAGHTYVLRAGEEFEETIVVQVTDETREIQGVDCRIVVDIVLLLEDGEYEAVEVTDDFYAQSSIGDVYYCGEVARNFEDGLLVDLDGSFEAGRDRAQAGLLIMAAPEADHAHRQEYLLGEAEDVIRYVGVAEAPGADEGGENPAAAFSCAANGGCIKTEEFIPPEPEAGEFKYFLEDVGFVLGVGLEDGEPTGEREELLCTGDSLDVLSDPACGIADLAQLMEELCRLSPAFCEEE